MLLQKILLIIKKLKKKLNFFSFFLKIEKGKLINLIKKNNEK